MYYIIALVEAIETRFEAAAPLESKRSLDRSSSSSYPPRTRAIAGNGPATGRRLRQIRRSRSPRRDNTLPVVYDCDRRPGNRNARLI